MDRRDFVRVAGASGAAFALTPADLLFPGGDAVARVTSRQARQALERLRGEAPCRAEVRTERGGPRLFVNGTETLPAWGLSISLLETAENFTGMGMRLLQPQMGMASAWTGPGQYDFTALEVYLGKVLALAPDAFFFPRVQLLTPPWWKEAHPDETMRFGADVPPRNWDGWRTRPADNPLREGDHHFTNFYGEAWEASYASEVWRRDTGDMLKALVRFIEQSPLVSRFMGYFFVSGNTEEWNVGGDNWWPGYEAPMQREAGPVPTPAERLDASFGLLRDPDKEADVIRFYRRFHEVRAETIAHLARALKEEMTTPVVTGTFFGYLMETPRIQESGHLAPRAVLESPHLDIVACPYTYVATNDPAKARWESDLYDGAENWVGRSRGVGGDGALPVDGRELPAPQQAVRLRDRPRLVPPPRERVEGDRRLGLDDARGDGQHPAPRLGQRPRIQRRRVALRLRGRTTSPTGASTSRRRRAAGTARPRSSAPSAR